VIDGASRRWDGPASLTGWAWVGCAAPSDAATVARIAGREARQVVAARDGSVVGCSARVPHLASTGRYAGVREAIRRGARLTRGAIVGICARSTSAVMKNGAGVVRPRSTGSRRARMLCIALPITGAFVGCENGHATELLTASQGPGGIAAITPFSRTRRHTFPVDAVRRRTGLPRGAVV
jgi:hypothetical protein